MRPDSRTAEMLVLAGTVIAAGVLSAAWGAARGWRRIGLRTLAVGACLATASSAGLIWVNRQVDAYPTWSSVFGSTTGGPPPCRPLRRTNPARDGSSP